MHAGHPISFTWPTGEVGEEADRYVDDGGAEAARGGAGVAESAFGRGTPQSTHLAPVGLAPGGLIWSHTSHCQLPSVSCASSTVGASEVK